MNKKQFNRIKSLYRDGVSLQVCVTSIMEMSDSDFEAATFIVRFYTEMRETPLLEELHTTTLELRQWQEIEERIKDTTVLDAVKEIENESSNGEESPDVEDQRPDQDKRVPRMS